MRNFQDIFKDQNSIKNINNILPILECSARCSCSFFANNCENRCVQFGASLPLEARLQKRLKKKVRVFDAGEKGYGLQCREQIKKGRFVIEYIGEVIGSDEVEKRRSKTNYVLTVKEIFRDHTELTYIDPSVRGNQSRFINHGCNPNLVMILVRYGTPQVHVGLFALRDIPAYEELTYDYGAMLMNVNKSLYSCDEIQALRSPQYVKGFPNSKSMTQSSQIYMSTR
ncbi:unnamed protein product [Onchocerca flexuosa]|uniref:SET domain-containing protein n=1 Tax=Onchocerca flexuosa TaxID=387005 RepID=A0A3P7V4J4_9BILA|nr:unnamed protein product [Onchocerca flexuosa]